MIRQIANAPTREVRRGLPFVTRKDVCAQCAQTSFRKHTGLGSIALAVSVRQTPKK